MSIISFFCIIVMFGGLLFVRRWVSNISKKTYRHYFDAASQHYIHPLRSLSSGTDRLLVTPNLLAIADTGDNMGTSEEENDQFVNKLFKILQFFFYQQPERYADDVFSLVRDAVEVNDKKSGSCSFSVAVIHPEKGNVNFYYIGDCVYGIFGKEKVGMVEGQFESFHQAKKIGSEDAEQLSKGYTEHYQKNDIKEDVIVMGTNGLWDNVSLDMIHHQSRGANSFVKQKQTYSEAIGVDNQPVPKSVQEIADRICGLGAYFSRKGNYSSPFFLRGEREGVKVAREGYLDDVSVIVGRVVRRIEIE